MMGLLRKKGDLSGWIEQTVWISVWRPAATGRAPAAESASNWATQQLRMVGSDVPRLVRVRLVVEQLDGWSGRLCADGRSAASGRFARSAGRRSRRTVPVWSSPLRRGRPVEAARLCPLNPSGAGSEHSPAMWETRPRSRRSRRTLCPGAGMAGWRIINGDRIACSYRQCLPQIACSPSRNPWSLHATTTVLSAKPSCFQWLQHAAQLEHPCSWWMPHKHDASGGRNRDRRPGRGRRGRSCRGTRRCRASPRAPRAGRKPAAPGSCPDRADRTTFSEPRTADAV
jgi:hypothetical protein